MTHLRKQVEGLARVADQVDHHVVVAIDDDDVARTVRAAGTRTQVVPFRSATRRLPMAAARNLGAQTAIGGGAELLIFLDVDCVPALNMVSAYRRAAAHPDHRDALQGLITLDPAGRPSVVSVPAATSPPDFP